MKMEKATLEEQGFFPENALQGSECALSCAMNSGINVPGTWNVQFENHSLHGKIVSLQKFSEISIVTIPPFDNYPEYL